MKISIITVTYNCKKDLKETIKSVESQTYKNIEHIIVDGASSDGTLDVIREYYNKNKNVKYISEEDKGIYDAMNKAINLSTGDVLFFLNAKDIFYDKNTIKNIISEFNSDCNTNIIYGNIIITGKKNSRIKHDYNLKKQIIMKGICHQAIFFKRECFEYVGDFNTEYIISADFDLILRMFVNKLKFRYVNIDIAFYDDNGVSSNIKNQKVAINEYREIINNVCNKNDKILPNIRYIYMMIKLYIKKGLNRK